MNAMSQPTVFDLHPTLARPKGRAGWDASFGPVLAELRARLQARHPEEIALLAGSEWAEETAVLWLDWLGELYRIAWPALVAYPANGPAPCPAHIQGLLLYYLDRADGAPLADHWIAFRELPDGWLYHQAFQGYTGHVLGADAGQ